VGSYLFRQNAHHRPYCGDHGFRGQRSFEKRDETDSRSDLAAAIDSLSGWGDHLRSADSGLIRPVSHSRVERGRAATPIRSLRTTSASSSRALSLVSLTRSRVVGHAA